MEERKSKVRCVMVLPTVCINPRQDYAHNRASLFYALVGPQQAGPSELLLDTGAIVK